MPLLTEPNTWCRENSSPRVYFVRFLSFLRLTSILIANWQIAIFLIKSAHTTHIRFVARSASFAKDPVASATALGKQILYRVTRRGPYSSRIHSLCATCDAVHPCPGPNSTHIVMWHIATALITTPDNPLRAPGACDVSAHNSKAGR